MLYLKQEKIKKKKERKKYITVLIFFKLNSIFISKYISFWDIYGCEIQMIQINSIGDSLKFK